MAMTAPVIASGWRHAAEIVKRLRGAATSRLSSVT
jgi:hypothetical protein